MDPSHSDAFYVGQFFGWALIAIVGCILLAGIALAAKLIVYAFTTIRDIGRKIQGK